MSIELPAVKVKCCSGAKLREGYRKKDTENRAKQEGQKESDLNEPQINPAGIQRRNSISD